MVYSYGFVPVPVHGVRLPELAVLGVVAVVAVLRQLDPVVVVHVDAELVFVSADVEGLFVASILRCCFRSDSRWYGFEEMTMLADSGSYCFD